jgi:inorganic pyrophosphatase
MRVDIVTGAVPAVGYVANSLAENGEPLEAVLLSPSRVLTPRCEHRARVVAAVWRVGEDAAVATVICVPEDSRVEAVPDAADGLARGGDCTPTLDGYPTCPEVTELLAIPDIVTGTVLSWVSRQEAERLTDDAEQRFLAMTGSLG